MYAVDVDACSIKTTQWTPHQLVSVECSALFLFISFYLNLIALCRTSVLIRGV
jgi:hypothetical protein